MAKLIKRTRKNRDDLREEMAEDVLNKAGNSDKLKRKRFGLKRKLLIAILIPLIIVLVVVGAMLTHNVKGSVNQLNGSYLSAEAGRAQVQVDKFFSEVDVLLRGISEDAEIESLLKQWKSDAFKKSPQKNAIASRLAEATQVNDHVMGGFIANLKTGATMTQDGTYYTKNEIDQQSREWYINVMDKKDVAITSAYEDVATGKLVVTLAAPIAINGEVAGIAGLDIELDSLNQILSQIKIGKSGYIVVFDDEGNCVYHPQDDLILKNVKEMSFEPAMEEALESGKEVTNMNGLHGDLKLNITTKVVPQIDYLVMATVTQDEFFQESKSLSKNVVLFFLLIIILITIIIVAVSNLMTVGLKKLSGIARELANGDLDVVVDFSSNDEIGDLADNIKKIVARLREYIEYIGEITRALDVMGKGNFVFDLEQSYEGEFAKVKAALIDVRDKMSETLLDVVETANKVDSGANQVAQGAQAQAQGATEQASSIEELAATLAEVTEQINKTTENIGITERETESAVGELNIGTEKMRAMLQAMEDISDNSMEIEKIIKNIEDIAFQTNILALNAAVEAARAGEAGKGFAVVADEVRNLAGKTADASKMTAGLIEKALVAVENGKGIADETAESFRNINEKVNNVAARTEEISENARQQDEAIQQTNLGVEQISSVVQTNSATAEESAAASAELLEQSNALKELVEGFKLQ